MIFYQLYEHDNYSTLPYLKILSLQIVLLCSIPVIAERLSAHPKTYTDNNGLRAI